MAVQVQRDPDLAVSEAFRGDLGVNAIGEQVGCMGVPEVMKPDIFYPKVLFGGASCGFNYPGISLDLAFYISSKFIWCAGFRIEALS